MTKGPGCRDIERLILEREDAPLGAGGERLVADHLRVCARCRDFEAARARMREELSAMAWPPLPQELVRRAHILARRAVAGGTDGTGEGTVPLPKTVLAALGAIIVLIAVWLSATLADVHPGQALAELPLAAKAALLLIVQNAFMLFFAPIILKAVRPSGEGHLGSYGHDSDMNTRRSS